MQEERMLNEESTPPANSVAADTNVSHEFYEVGNEILAKPDALADILLTQGLPGCAIYCNSPSDADLVDVILKKRGIACSKLIGNVPPQRVIQEKQRLVTKEICAMIITDVSGKDLEINGIDMIINYGIPSNPEIYLHRITGFETCTNPLKVVSLVNPLDFGDFHYLRKVVTYDFNKQELPSKEAVVEAETNVMFLQAAAGPHLQNEKAAALVAKVLAHANRDQVITLLLHNTMEVIPALAKEAAAGRGGRNNNRRDRNERGERSERGGDRDGSEGGRHNRRRDRGSDDYQDRDASSERSERPRRERDLPPPPKDTRLYVATSSVQGLSKEDFEAVLSAECGLEAAEVKRFISRSAYSFVDVKEELAEQIISKLETATLKNGDSLIVKKATLISAPREESASDESEGSTGSSADSYAGESEGDDSAGQDFESDDSYEGPNGNR